MITIFGPGLGNAMLAIGIAQVPLYARLTRAAVLRHMQQQGAQVIIAESPAPGVNIDGWERLPSAGVPRPELIVYTGVR